MAPVCLLSKKEDAFYFFRFSRFLACFFSSTSMTFDVIWFQGFDDWLAFRLDFMCKW